MARSAVYSVLSLVAAMCFMAGLFVLQRASFLATVLVLVYAGAILVLFLFVVMLLDYRKLTMGWRGARVGAIFSVLLTCLFVWGGYRVIQTIQGPATPAFPQGTAQALGRLLFTNHVMAFELTSILILAATVSVVVLAKKGPS